jgi:hypothetical protein
MTVAMYARRKQWLDARGIARYATDSRELSFPIVIGSGTQVFFPWVRATWQPNAGPMGSWF